eukprot:15449259-Alexandrium_andersonii.AAC.1
MPCINMVTLPGSGSSSLICVGSVEGCTPTTQEGRVTVCMQAIVRLGRAVRVYSMTATGWCGRRGSTMA